MTSQCWLPPEVWTMVFQMFSEEDCDIESVRLTCKSFEELATPFLLPPPRIICAPLSGSLATLTAVSRHPVLSKSVKEIVYDCNRYHFVESITEYKEALRRADGFKEPKSDEENRGLKTAFSQYRQTYDDQARMENSGEVIACLCSALTRMPHIKEITISPNFDCFLDSQSDSIYFLEPDPAYNEAFLLMARVLSLTGAKIHHFNIEINDEPIGDRDPVGVNGALFRVMSNSNLNHCCNAFRVLRRVTITAEENDVDGWMTGNLAKMLSGATDLKRLDINGCHPTFQISTKYILSTTTWSRLKSLNFTHVTLDQRDFLDLLRRHSGTLKDMYLFCVCLTNGSWKILLEGSKSYLSLQRISIDYPSEKHGEGYKDIYLKHALKNCLLSDGSPPLSE
ncbi:hypothetical protein VE04_05116, partial [Pseudogymnoascus sp. 24MN13]